MYLASDSSLEIVGRGRVRIQFPYGRIKGIDGLMNIPSLAWNFIFISNLNDVDVQVTLSGGGCKMTRGWIVLSKVAQIGTLFKMDDSLFNVTVPLESQRRLPRRRTLQSLWR